MGWCRICRKKPTKKVRLSSREIEDLEYWFQDIDRNGSGKISRYELKDYMFFCYGERVRGKAFTS